MTIKERAIILKINEQIKKLSAPPLTTFSPQTGNVLPPAPVSSPVTPLPLTPPANK